MATHHRSSNRSASATRAAKSTQPPDYHSTELPHYDPTAGLFISEDPIGFSGDNQNLVRYVENNAANLVDPFGHDAQFPVIDADGIKYSFWMDAQGYRGGDFSSADSIAKEIASSNGQSGRNTLKATWHHADFNPKTGQLLMELVDNAHHASIQHHGGIKKMADWVAETLKNGNIEKLNQGQFNAVTNALRYSETSKLLRTRLSGTGISWVMKGTLGAQQIVLTLADGRTATLLHSTVKVENSDSSIWVASSGCGQIWEFGWKGCARGYCLLCCWQYGIRRWGRRRYCDSRTTGNRHGGSSRRRF